MRPTTAGRRRTPARGTARRRRRIVPGRGRCRAAMSRIGARRRSRGGGGRTARPTRRDHDGLVPGSPGEPLELRDPVAVELEHGDDRSAGRVVVSGEDAPVERDHQVAGSGMSAASSRRRAGRGRRDTPGTSAASSFELESTTSQSVGSGTAPPCTRGPISSVSSGYEGDGLILHLRAAEGAKTTRLHPVTAAIEPVSADTSMKTKPRKTSCIPVG